ncbi:MAG: exodeoxyribonuclease VII small subunit [Candidatus Competibacteraceae bacterium]|nr:exodeoxyribonuclease VII small subunit [Candidatus Competibacteraceae bacterium]
MNSTNETYSRSLQELEEIVSQLEKGNISVDELAEKTKRASELIAFCRNKLRQTQHEVEQTLKDME